MTTPRLLDLAARSLGGSVMHADDESFGEKENLVLDAPAVVAPGRFGHKGELVDGWETRRRRGAPGHDRALVRLGAPGVVRSVDIDTTGFTGNFPTHARVEGCGLDGHPSVAELQAPEVEWEMLAPWVSLRGDDHHVVPVSSPTRVTHVRLSMRPDGGIARLRVHGRALPDPRTLDGLTVDLAARELGGLVEASSDDFYTRASVLNRPDLARSMGEGWETRRRRDDGHDWVVLRLAAAARPEMVEIDTSYFVLNASAEVELWGAHRETAPEPQSPEWFPVLPRLRLQPDTRHRFRVPPGAEMTHVRLDAFPDGGISRVRLPGRVVGPGRRLLGLRWLNALPVGQLRAVLADAGIQAVAPLLAARPLTEHPTGTGGLGSVVPELSDAESARLLALVAGPRG